MKFSCSTFYFSHPCTVKHGALVRTTKQDQDIIDYFLNIKPKADYLPKSEHGWRTDSFAHLEHGEVLKELLDQIHLWYCSNICPPRGPEFITNNYNEITNTDNLEIDANVWFQESLTGQVTQQHDHGTLARYSWVYYLSCDGEPSPLTFVKRDEVKSDIENVDELHLPVYNKMIVMFPSVLHHKVYPAKDKRYILAGNINDINFKESV